MSIKDKRRIHDTTARVLSLVLLLLFLGACDERREETPAVDADAKLMNDLGQAGPELERRLLNSVSVQDSFIIVSAPPLGNTYVLPANSPWVISCGEGVSVTFGSAVFGDRSFVGNDVQIELTTTLINQSDCATLALSLGRHLKAMLEERTHSQ
jgi:hypothetical protein